MHSEHRLSSPVSESPTPGVLAAFPAPADGGLCGDMRVAFDRDGVIVLKGFADPAACAGVKQRAFEMIDDFDIDAHGTVFSTTSQAHANDDYFLSSGDKIAFFLEEEAFDDKGALTRPKRECVNKIGHAMHDLDPVFSRFSRTSALEAIVRSLGFRDPKLLQSMVIFKPPGIGGEVTCHQDSTFLYTEPETCVGFWFALDEATTDNGCMELIPGGHKEPLRQRFRRKGTGTQFEIVSDIPFAEEKRVAAPASIGDLVIFSGRAPHMSRANRSARSRCAYTLHIIDGAAQYPADNWLQRSTDMPLKGF